MRLLGPLSVLFGFACLSATGALAQGAGPRPEEQRQAVPSQPEHVASQPAQKFESYHKHRDARHGHKHVYPDRGAIFREAPKGSVVVNYAGLAFRFHDGVWFEPQGPAFLVVAPPIGVVVPTLPTFATPVTSDGETYLYANDVYYRARPELGGYEVVNDPVDTSVASDAADAPPPSTPPAASVPAGAPLAAAASTTLAALPAATVPATTAGAMAAPAAQPATGPQGAKVFAYPRNGQSPEQQASDRYECYRFGVAQSGFDPMASNGGAQAAGRQAEFDRAQAACFDGRGYTVR